MRCNYFDKNGFCKAIPSSDKEVLKDLEYKPTEDEVKDYCTNSLYMETCPRLNIYKDYLKALRKKGT